MEQKIIVSRINNYIYQATILLANWLSEKLPKFSQSWWEECVLDKLSCNQRLIAEEKGFTKLSDFDLAALLRIADRNWYALREVTYLPNKERECLHRMVSVRNNWAHCSGVLPGKDAIISDLNTVLEFLGQMNCDIRLYNEVEGFLYEVEKSNLEEVSAHDVTNRQIVVNENFKREITEKDFVYVVAEPDLRGVVLSVQNIGGLNKYQVFVNGNLRTFLTGQIALCEEKSAYNWVDIDTFQSSISSYQINNPSASNLYSLNSARIDFVPYQFRPALKIINSDEPRILIADSVGVGKTIEAGLIIKELDARDELARVMIICPKPLVAEHKWLNEMRRFDEEFEELDGYGLRQLIDETETNSEWSSRHGKVIVPYSILDSRVYEGEKEKKHKTCGLIDLDPPPHFDLVIVDEAHHIRNGSMDKEKAYAYKCVKYFCDHADAVVMLTATPLQNSNDDLFTLLNILRPQIVIDKGTFNVMSKPNKYISECSHILRTATGNWQEDALNSLLKIMSTQWGENVISKNPKYHKAIAVLKQDEVSREERVELISEVESLHSFDSMINRTRRKDIQDFCVRRTHTLETHFTEEQKKLHDEILSFERIALSELHDSRSVPFMMSTIKRQAASCIFGLAPYVRDLIDRRINQIADDAGVDIEDCDFNILTSVLNKSANRILELADNLPEEDPKFDEVYELIKRKNEQENNKIILFSTFRHTLAYVKKKLLNNGVRVEQIDGSVKDETRWELRKRFELPKQDPDALDMLLFTEVGSEGLDYQFCDTMINYDLPWNPMRIEQRVGRIDRRGQVSEVVNINNVITEGTVDADIYNRCLLRIGIFEQSIGECEEILGEIGNQIETVALDSSLTDEERRVKLEVIADNEIRRIQEMNRLESEAKGLFGFDLSAYTLAKEIQEAESPWLSPHSLQFLVERYLTKRLGEKTYIWGNDDVKNLRLSVEARSIIKDDFRKLSNVRSAIKQSWEYYLKGTKPNLKITFLQEAAEKNRDAQFITTVHPLVKQAAKYFETTELMNINMAMHSETIKAGIYPFSVYVWKYVGIKPSVRIKVICGNDEVVLEWNEIMQCAKTVPIDSPIEKNAWDLLEKKNIEQWKSEKQKYIEELKSEVAFRLETINNNFNQTILSLEQRLRDAMDERMIRMYQSMIEGETEKYKIKIEELKRKGEQADIHFTLIANGILTIE